MRRNKMARIVEELLILKLSRIVKNDADESEMLDQNMQDSIGELVEANIQELTGITGVVVEVERE
jgi:hypothetical protein